MIVIFNSNSVYNETVDTWSRTAYMWIRNGGATAYMHTKGGLSNEGDLQAILNAMEATLYAEAAASGLLPTAKEAARADREIYLAANPNAGLVFSATAAQIETATDALIEASFPGVLLTTAQKNRWKRVLNVGMLLDREQVAGE